MNSTLEERAIFKRNNHIHLDNKAMTIQEDH